MELIEYVYLYQIISLLVIISITSYIIHNKVTDKLSSEIEGDHSSSPIFDLYDGNKDDENCKYYLVLGYIEHEVVGEEIYYTYIEYLYQWKHTSFCYPESVYNYTELLNNYSVQQGEKCREGYKQCGILDSVGNILCLEEEQKCPINDMIIVKTGEVPEAFMKYKNVTKLPIGDEDVLYYTNEAIDKEIIVSLKVKKKEPKDKFYTFLDSMSKYEFAVQNGVKKESKKNKKKIKGNLYLYYRTYIGYDKNCINSKLFWENNTKIFSKSTIARRLIIVILSFSLLFLYAYTERYTFDHLKFILVFYIILLLFFLCFALPSYLLLRNVNNDIKSCSDEYYDELIHNLNNKKKTNEILVLVIIIIISLMILVTLLILIHKKIKKCIKKIEKNDKEQKVTFSENVPTIRDLGKIEIIKRLSHETQILSVIILNHGCLLLLTPKTLIIYDESFNIQKFIEDKDEMISVCQLEDDHLVTSHTNNILKIRTLSNYSIKRCIIENTITKLVSLPNNRFASNSGNQIVSIQTLSSSKLLTQTKIKLKGKVSTMTHCKEQKLFIVISKNEIINVYNTNNFTCVLTYINVYKINFFHCFNNNLLIIGDKNEYKVINIITKTCKRIEQIIETNCIINLTKDIYLIGEKLGLQLINLKNNEHSVIGNCYYKIDCLQKIKENLIMAYSEKTLIIMKYIKYFSIDEKEMLITINSKNYFN